MGCLLRYEPEDLQSKTPRDKGPVEGMVQRCTMPSYSELHDEIFYNIDSMNSRIYELMDEFNNKVSRGDRAEPHGCLRKYGEGGTGRTPRSPIPLPLPQGSEADRLLSRSDRQT